MMVMQVKDRTITTHNPRRFMKDGKLVDQALPVFVDVNIREATTSPTGARLKVCFRPDTQSRAGKAAFRRIVPELRLEMN